MTLLGVEVGGVLFFSPNELGNYFSPVGAVFWPRIGSSIEKNDKIEAFFLTFRDYSAKLIFTVRLNKVYNKSIN